MRAWTIDADDIHETADFADELLTRTTAIDHFLDRRDGKFIVIGTKGFGKTLLLKAKRIALQENGGMRCIPDGALLDKPAGDKVFSKEQLAAFTAGTDAWERVWRIAIGVAALKAVGAAGDIRATPELYAILRDDGIHTVLDHFTAVLELSVGDLHRCAADVERHVLPRVRRINTPVAFFIDGVDESLKKHVSLQRHVSSVTGAVAPDVWHYAQTALVKVAYAFRRLNHHVKVFAAVRKECFLRLRDDEMYPQYLGSVVDLTYSKDDLRDIFIRNIRRSGSDLLHRDEVKARPLEAFLGRSTVRHVYTRELEDVFDYVYRHTFGRPRDLMVIGHRLKGMGAERKKEESFKRAVNEAATIIAREYLAEVAPYLGVELEPVLERLPSNVLTPAQLDQLRQAVGGVDDVCLAMHRAGLLGHVHLDHVTAKEVQRFTAPGEAILDVDRRLPDARRFLVHPALSELVVQRNGAYANAFDPVNVIGNERPWYEPGTVRFTETLSVLVGDIVGFRTFMEGRTDGLVREALRMALDTHAARSLVSGISDGDGFHVVDPDGLELIKIGRRIAEDLAGAPGTPRVRLAMQRGDVSVRHDAEGRRLDGGSAVLEAARMLPRVPPGAMWATAEFKRALDERPHIYTLRPLHEEAVDFRKSDEEAPLMLRVFDVS